MTTKERICIALTGQMPDRVPFTAYIGLASGSQEEIDKLVAQGMGFVTSWAPYSARHRNVEIIQKDEVPGDIPTRVTIYKTPIGEIQQRHRTEHGYGSSWRIEHIIKDVKDYKVLEFIIRDVEYTADYEPYGGIEASLGDSGIAMASIGRVPIQRLWIEYTGIERLSMDLYDNPSAVESVLEAMMDKSREVWNIVADSPSQFVWCPDNITGVITGPPLFDRYCVPYYNEVADIMHRKGKRLLCHMDGMMRRLVNSVQKTRLDIIEAFNPPPDGDLSVAETRKYWQGKVISINFPSSVHIAKPETIRDVTLQLLRESAPGNGFVIGVTENIPASVGIRSLSVIAETINKHGNCPISI